MGEYISEKQTKQSTTNKMYVSETILAKCCPLAQAKCYLLILFTILYEVYNPLRQMLSIDHISPCKSFLFKELNC